MFQIDRLKNKLENGGIAIGTHLKWSNSNFVELFALAGFDYIWLDGEHGTMSLDTINNNIRIAQSNGVAAIYRVPWNDPVRVKPILEMGPDGIVFPFIRTAEEARLAVASCKYPPQGIRGYAPGRAIRYGLTPLDKYLEEVKKTWVIMQIEHIDAVRNLDEILSVPGVDACIIGMMDLSASIGMLGQVKSPEVTALLDEIGEKITRAGKPFGVAMGYDDQLVEDWIRRGAQMIGVGGEEEFLCKASLQAIQNVNTIRQHVLNI